jgi:hypothetical protein
MFEHKPKDSISREELDGKKWKVLFGDRIVQVHVQGKIEPTSFPYLPCYAKVHVPTMLTPNLREMEETCKKYLIYYKKKVRGRWCILVFPTTFFYRECRGDQ